MTEVLLGLAIVAIVLLCLRCRELNKRIEVRELSEAKLYRALMTCSESLIKKQEEEYARRFEVERSIAKRAIHENASHR